MEKECGTDIALVYAPSKEKIAWLFSLPSLGGYLKRQGFSVEVIDAPFLDMGVTETIEEIRRLNPMVIGLSIPMTLVVYESVEFLKVMRKSFPDTPIICGGIHPTLVPEDTVLHCDAVVVGEGELTTEEILNRIKEGRDFHDVAGICYLGEHGKPAFTSPRTPAASLDELGPPDWSLIPFKKWAEVVSLPLDNKFTMPINSSRGCPFNCAFCANERLTGRRVRFRAVDAVVDEMERAVREYGVDRFFFQDEVFTIDADRVERFCDELDKRGLDVKWNCQTRADCIKEETVARLKRSGCTRIGFGLESADPEILRIMRKQLDLDKVRETVRACKKHGVFVSLSLLVGVPGETPESIRRSLEFLKECTPDVVTCFEFMPYPAIELTDVALEQGGIKYINWTEMRSSRTSWDPPYLAPGLEGVPIPLIVNAIHYRLNVASPARFARMVKMTGLPVALYLAMKWFRSTIRLRRRGVRL